MRHIKKFIFCIKYALRMLKRQERMGVDRLRWYIFWRNFINCWKYSFVLNHNRFKKMYPSVMGEVDKKLLYVYRNKKFPFIIIFSNLINKIKL